MFQYFRNTMVKKKTKKRKKKGKGKKKRKEKKENSQNTAPSDLHKANRNVDAGLCPGLLFFCNTYKTKVRAACCKKIPCLSSTDRLSTSAVPQLQNQLSDPNYLSCSLYCPDLQGHKSRLQSGNRERKELLNIFFFKSLLLFLKGNSNLLFKKGNSN